MLPAAHREGAGPRRCPPLSRAVLGVLRGEGARDVAHGAAATYRLGEGPLDQLVGPLVVGLVPGADPGDALLASGEGVEFGGEAVSANLPPPAVRGEGQMGSVQRREGSEGMNPNTAWGARQ